MNLQKQLENASREAIAKVLPEGATLVEFARYDVANFKAVKANGDSRWLPARYVAFILAANQPDRVVKIDLKEPEPIDELIREFRKAISGERDFDPFGEEPSEPAPILSEYTQNLAAQLYDKLIVPLKPYLQPDRKVFLAPDGELSCLPFGVLSANGAQYLMEEYSLSYLSVGRDVLRFNFPIPAESTEPLVIVDPDYNLAVEVAQTSQPALQTRAAESPDTEELRREFTRSNGKGFKPIPGTGIEGEQIAQLLKVPLHADAKAVKSLVSRCKSPKIIHIATHGYFLEDIPEKPIAPLNPQRFTTAAQQNPLVRSGLAFAGANTILKGGKLPQEAEDALLTAQAAAGLNLPGTALVVASACQTALGNVNIGEGVLGLRRAFVLAGAQTLVMSLWSVPDVSTAILMQQFYHNLFNSNMGRAKALEYAQYYVRDLTVGQMRQQWLSPAAINWVHQRSPKIAAQLHELSLKPDDYRPYVHPKYWGAFICQGNPDPFVLSVGALPGLGD